MLTRIFPFEDNACDAKEVFSTMDPHCEVDTLSVSLQSCEPFSATGLDLGKSFDEPGIPIADGLLGDFKSIVVTSSSGERFDDGVDTIRNNDVSKTKSPEIIPLLTRRSTRKSVLKQKIDTKRAGRKCRQTSDRRRMLDIVFLTVARKRRSFLYTRARFSSWGLMQNIINVFGQHASKSTDQNIHSGSEQGRTIMRGEKSDENQVLESLQRSKDETQVKPGGIRLKFKLRNKTIQSCQLNTIPVMDRDVQLYREVKIDSPNSEHNMEDKLEEALPRSLSSQCFNENVDKALVVSEASVLDPIGMDKERSENVIEKGGEKNGVSSKEGLGVGERVENGCLDPGTSPDSEVINLTPETHINGVSSEDVLDILVPSQGYVAPGDVTSLIQTSKKGNKESNICQIGNFEVEGGVPSPEIIDTVVLCDKNGQKEEMGDGTYSNGASISTAFGVASSNAFSSVGCPVEPLTLSRKTDVGAASEVLKDEPGEQVDIGVGVELLDLRLSDKLLPPGTKGQKLQKSSSSSKKKSEKPDSVNKKQTTSRKKGLERKSTTKGKTKEKNGDDHVGCHVQSNPQIGNDRLDDIREVKEGHIATSGDLCSSSMISSGVEDQHFPPRNAWVCCDECHKWRRIPAILADTIEATDCRWVCEDNMDKTFANCSIPQEKSNAKINEELEISDAEEDGYSARPSSGRLGQKQTSDKPPSSWKLIRSNLFLHRHRKNQPIDEIMVCHCKPPLDGRSGCRDGCLNRMLNIECVKGTCPCGELCSNQQFQKRKYAKLKCFRCGKKGYGLQLQEDIPKGRFLIEYVGEVLDMNAYGARQREYASKGHKHFYFMTLNGSEVIDACAKGNLGRFINHSCEPNCRTEKWMVNGEVCIGLFALRDIKKGEELTFDYNYVRVFGAAAKKCVCGSSRCRGFIGGDPENAETVIQSDSDEEFPEPVMLYEDGTDKLDSTISVTISSAGVGLQSTEKKVDELDNSAVAARQLDDTVSNQTSYSLLGEGNGDSGTASVYLEDATESSDFCAKSPPIASKSDTSLNVEAAEGPIPFSVQPIISSLQPHDEKSEIIFESPLQPDEDVKQPVCTVERTETSFMSSSVSNFLPSTADTKKKPKTPTDENARTVMKPHRRTKISRPPSSMKKGKPKTNAVIMTKPPEVENKALPGPCRPKKQVEDTLDGRFEAVQETLANLLDADGGISKRRDASRGYLKLLYLTAASGGSGSGEGIQSNRDLSMILDGLLKTKSRTVLVDIINKNGLQMLHNIMKRYRKDFNKIPILRKLLKVLEYLAERRILTLENITRAPPHDGVESFRESILSLTEHIDKQVHQIARNFRDRWIPRAFRKINCIDRDVDSMEIQKCLNFSRFPASQDHSCSQDGKQKETIDDSGKQSPIMHDTPQVDTGTVDGSSASCCSTDGTVTRKRKTRWDQPADAGNDSLISPPNKECRSENGDARYSQQGMETSVVMCEEREHISDDDAPPGFSSPLNAKSSIATDFEAVAGYPQERFNSRLSISYGVPLAMLGTHQPATGESWFEASAVRFYPFPPLPSYPRAPNCGTVIQNQSIPTTSGASPNPPDVAIAPFNHQHNFQRFRGSSLNNSLGRRYFRQQKWPHPRYGAAWNSRKNDGGRFMEANNSNYGVGINGNEQPKGPYGPSEVERCGNGFYQPEQQ